MTNVLSAMRVASDWELILGKGVKERLPDPVNARNVVESCCVIETARNDWAMSVDPTRTVYLKCSLSRELSSAVECANSVDCEIPPFLIVTGTNVVAPWFI